MRTSTPTGKRMALRRDDRCVACATPLAAGTVADWFADERVVRCTSCPGVAAEAASARPLPPPVAAAPTGRPGGSARREYERRSANERRRKEAVIAADAEWRAQAKQKHPIGGRIVTAMTSRPTIGPESQPTSAWATGAAGEERVAEFLAGATGVVSLHDRLAGRGKANLDHIAITPGGVYVVDAKNHKGRIEVRAGGGRFDSRSQLWVGTRNCTKLVESMSGQVEAVRRALGPEWAHVPVHPVLCFVDGDWPRLFRPKRLGTVQIMSPATLAKAVSQPGEWTALVPAIARRLDLALIPATTD